MLGVVILGIVILVAVGYFAMRPGDLDDDRSDSHDSDNDFDSDDDGGGGDGGD